MSSPPALPDRIRALVKVAGSGRKLATIVGVTNPSVSYWLKGAGMYDSTLEEIADKTGVSLEWLRDGEGFEGMELEKFRARLEKRKDVSGAIVREDPSSTVVGVGGLVARRIPIISQAQAGPAMDMEWHDVDDFEGVEMFAVKDPRAIAVRIRGDSMAPTYPEGTIAVMYPSFPVRSENLVIARLSNGSVIFKRVHIEPEHFRFISINDKYPPMVVPKAEVERMFPVGKTERDEL